VERYLNRIGWSAAAARDTAVRVHERKTELIVELALAGRIPIRPGVDRLVGQLLAADVDLHVVTTGSARWVRPLLASAFGSDTFGTVITSEDVLELKPSPQAYLNLLQRTGLGAWHVVAVEDSAVGLAAARGAGLACVVVRDPYADDGPFPGAALVCSGFEELCAEVVLGAAPCRGRRAAATRATFAESGLPARRDCEFDES
jgi:HAD superfamily hydrolase (TIGR01509 family)